MRAERVELDCDLGVQREGRQAAEAEHGRAQAALDVEQRSRGQLERDLATAQQRLGAVERARDTAIATVEHAATRARAQRRKPER